MVTISTDEPAAQAVVAAIHGGDLDALRRLLSERPGLAGAQLGNEPAGDDSGMARSLLHVVTDWPGHYPNGAATVALLVEAGADVNARFTGPHAETPLHWAASSDDVEVLEALLDAGADIEAPGAVIAGGTPLTDAVAFGQWQAARRLVERGANTPLREAAALGLMERVEGHWAGDHPPDPEETTQAFWYACHGGQQPAAEYLLDRGAEINWVSTWDHLTPLDAAQRSEAGELGEWLRGRGGQSAAELSPGPLFVLLDLLAAFRRGDHAAARGMLASDVTWQGLREGWACHGPDEVLSTLQGGFAYVHGLEDLEFVPAGEHIVLGVRSPRLEAIDDVVLGGTIFNVFTVRDGRIVRIRDYRHRAEALDAAGAVDPGWH